MLSSCAVVMLAMIIHEGRSLVSNKLSSTLDLSHPLNNDTQYWIPEEKFYITNQVVEDSPTNFYAANSFIGHEHCGTHLDAPYHYCKTGWKVDEIPLQRLILSPGAYIDISDKVNHCNFALLPEHLTEWIKTNGFFPPGAILLINFGWWSRYNNRLDYFGNFTKPYCFPGISAEAARWIADYSGVHGVALDTPSIDVGNSDTFPAHIALLSSNIFGIENINFNNTHLQSTNFKVIALPMKITGGSGAPCRVIVIPFT